MHVTNSHHGIIGIAVVNICWNNFNWIYIIQYIFTPCCVRTQYKEIWRQSYSYRALCHQNNGFALQNACLKYNPIASARALWFCDKSLSKVLYTTGKHAYLQPGLCALLCCFELFLDYKSFKWISWSEFIAWLHLRGQLGLCRVERMSAGFAL